MSQPLEIRPTPPGMSERPVTALLDRFDTARSDRTRLMESTIGLVENLCCHGMLRNGTPEEFSPQFQICLPYRGLFIWHVGADEVVADANQVLFVSGGETYHISRPQSAGYAELIVTPDRELLAEVAHASGAYLPTHPLFRRRSRRADLGLQHLRARFLHRAIYGDVEGVAAEELVIALLRTALVADEADCEPSRQTRRLIARTKEFLEAQLSRPIRLADVARAVGASPA